MKKPAFNPYLPGCEYVPDGEPHVFDGRVYIYGSHDRFGGEKFCMENYVCWSAPVDDLGNWKNEGEIYDKTRDPLCTGPDRLLFAPDVCRGPDGRYYLYYCFDFEGVVSVAVCGTPAGKYEFYGHVRWPDGTLLGRREGDPFQFDPGLLDDNGRVYLYTGFCSPNLFGEMRKVPDRGCMGVELCPDMLTVKSGLHFIAPCWANAEDTDFDGHEFFEAPSMRKVGERYYFIYSSLLSHELCYATGDTPLGSFRYGGTIISNGDIGLEGTGPEEASNYTGNNHGSIVEIGDRWYVFYHRHTNRGQFSRQGCAEKIEILPDGSIPQVEMTSCGLNGGPLPGHGVFEARVACNLMSAKGVRMYPVGGEIEDYHPYFTQGPDGVQYIANLTGDSLAGFKYFDLTGVKNISVWVRGTGTGQLLVGTYIEETALAWIDIVPTKEWTKYSASIEYRAPYPVTQLCFVYVGEGSVDFLKFELNGQEGGLDWHG